MRKRQRKKNNRTPQWLKRFRKKNDIKLISASELDLSVLKTGEIGSLTSCTLYN